MTRGNLSVTLLAPPTSSAVVAVADPSQVGQARRVAAAACRRLDLDEAAAGRACLLATEAAANVLRHGRGGEVVVRELRSGGRAGVEVLALDQGPGIANVGLALEDGHSSQGTSGTGLGAMKRAASVFEVFTQVGQGTAVLLQVWSGDVPAEARALGAVCLPKPGEEECGDAYAFDPRPGGGRLVLADGLGHGPTAHDAAVAAVEGARNAKGGPLLALTDAHAAARPTRGAAIAVADLDLARREIVWAGFGNVAGTICHGPGVHHLVSMNGTIGQGVLRSREFTYPFPAGALLVTASDGLATRWSLDRYPGLAARHPALVAGVLYRDHSRRRDDVTVVVVALGEAA
jgi:anti-sigma regulatory factor (Ser/Thr protein kinase)